MHTCLHDWALGELNDPIDATYFIAVLSTIGDFVGS